MLRLVPIPTSFSLFWQVINEMKQNGQLGVCMCEKPLLEPDLQEGERETRNKRQEQVAPCAVPTLDRSTSQTRRPTYH